MRRYPLEEFQHPSTLWFHAMYLMTATRTECPQRNLSGARRAYKCAWRIGHELRKLMEGKDVISPLKGHVEVDESTWPVAAQVSVVAARRVRRTIVFGMLERDGNINGEVVVDVKRNTLEPIITGNIVPGSIVSSDELFSYSRLRMPDTNMARSITAPSSTFLAFTTSTVSKDSGLTSNAVLAVLTSTFLPVTLRSTL